MRVRCKFQLTRKITEETPWGSYVKFYFTPNYDPAIPEDQVFMQYSPSGEFWINVTNPAVLEHYKVGEFYYFDSVPVNIGDIPETASD